MSITKSEKIMKAEIQINILFSSIICSLNKIEFPGPNLCMEPNQRFLYHLCCEAKKCVSYKKTMCI